MSAATPYKHLYKLRQTKIPIKGFWRWICPSCKTMNAEPESVLVYGDCTSCNRTRCREAKIVWINYIPPRRRDETPKPGCRVEEGAEDCGEKSEKGMGLDARDRGNRHGGPSINPGRH